MTENNLYKQVCDINIIELFEGLYMSFFSKTWIKDIKVLVKRCDLEDELAIKAINVAENIALNKMVNI